MDGLDSNYHERRGNAVLMLTRNHLSMSPLAPRACYALGSVERCRTIINVTERLPSWGLLRRANVQCPKLLRLLQFLRALWHTMPPTAANCNTHSAPTTHETKASSRSLLNTFSEWADVSIVPSRIVPYRQDSPTAACRCSVLPRKRCGSPVSEGLRFQRSLIKLHKFAHTIHPTLPCD